jgi:hypothetical protein
MFRCSSVSQHDGICVEHIKNLQFHARDLPDHARCGELLVDEIHIQAGIYYSQRNGALVGFGDTVDTLHKPTNDDGTLLADKMLQFMFRSLTTRWAFPVAHWSYRHNNAARLNACYHETLRALRLIDLKVLLTVLDGASENRLWTKIKLKGVQGLKSPDLFIGTKAWFFNPYGVWARERIWIMSDPPHLIKVRCYPLAFALFPWLYVHWHFP